ncbi:MAG: penicillin-binding protein 2 [Candidatus Sungbacteria bacterium RIFCSPLOWO2_02_FULL_54_10]|uniref:Penicillin-binding protein 2 n=2 Tax=Candidatus Sungiibacteriota TaxID=1817917 RepID=A0A1G2L6D0_9BACT|nr:MAG: penicillin-binding protein 2 [Candidatus Sungbacteria bacterium RIFCSPHIGHO2_01_FULL_54_26]OHA03369.1 MAG: penicillin-binding protein 2 [Candidatus Sungbacteria bacterium RIFCSPHIGHO2_02_FULL_53_17]OHA07217.1 MAG: penicillin-binding protein 2 [Candidatus Sungbacteria bacterium RIFCSPLOWO2_01_FULL_54_21]OHA12505.1 MAG: penicillin-binding protein 2 [Candidatus Sungbacteria bacterium RIFCSPLOWO2_02_FULL_54_10]
MRLLLSKKHLLRRSRHRVDPEEVFVDAALAARDPARAFEGRMERPLENRSSFWFLVIVACGIGYLLVRSFSLQVVSGNDFFAQSQENRFASRTLFAPRGIIRDRYGDALVENVPSLGLVFDREKFIEAQGNVPRLLTDLSVILDKPKEFFDELGFPQDGTVDKTPRKAFLARDLTREEIVALAPRLDDLPGVEVFESFQRKYLAPEALSHLLGFVGKVSAGDLEAHADLAEEETIGKSGIEVFYDAILRGNAGKKIVEVDSKGVETRFRLTEEPRQGVELALTIDGGLQQKVYDVIMGYTGGKKGASTVIIDPANGAVRALVSVPGFNANRFGHGLSQKEFSAILQDPLKPLFNRAVAGEFPSGSVIKPVFAAAALEEGIIDPAKKIFDGGYIEIPNPYRPGEVSRFVDWKKGGHGWVDMYDAIAYSVNVYFYTIGGGYKDQKGLGIERIKKYAARFGLGAALGIDLPGEKSGSIPDPETKKRTEPENPDWRIGDTYNISIGQGGLRATPLQMASLTAALGNGGTLWSPYIMDAVRDEEGNVVEKREPRAIRDHLVRPDVFAEIAKGMQGTVTYGTARLLQEVPVAVAAKTGTAQSAPGKLPHAWVIAYAPAEKPEIAVAVMVEYAGEGATVAVPITNEILKWYFSHRDHGSKIPQAVVATTPGVSPGIAPEGVLSDVHNAH